MVYLKLEDVNKSTFLNDSIINTSRPFNVYDITLNSKLPYLEKIVQCKKLPISAHFVPRDMSVWGFVIWEKNLSSKALRFIQEKNKKQNFKLI